MSLCKNQGHEGRNTGRDASEGQQQRRKCLRDRGATPVRVPSCLFNPLSHPNSIPANDAKDAKKKTEIDADETERGKAENKTL